MLSSARNRTLLGIAVVFSFGTLLYGGDAPGKVLRAGMIGLDTPHVLGFTKIFNNPEATGKTAAIRMVAGYPGGSDLEYSKKHVKEFTDELRSMGVRIYDSIPKLVENVDVVLVTSVDGRPHLEQVIPVFKARKPVYIDKPLAGSLSDCIAIAELAKKYEVPWFTASALRFTPGILEFRMESDKAGKVIGCSSWGPCPIEPTHSDLFWYGVHGAEILFTIMGPGCVRVSRVKTDGTELVTGVWSDGRIGTFRGIRDGVEEKYGAMVFGSKAIVQSSDFTGFEPLCEAMAKFFVTGKAPILPEETLEIFAFMEAADESKRRGGASVSVAEVLKSAREEAHGKIDR